MKSLIFKGSVMHARLRPVRHAFRYRVSFFAFDLDELMATRPAGLLFGYNRRAVFSLRDTDHLDTSTRPLKEKVLSLLAEKGQGKDVDKVSLVTGARFLGYAFNPVSFYYCYRADGSVACALAEVNNTFGERHVYLLEDPVPAKGVDASTFAAPKVFHVSPFNNVAGDYAFKLSPIASTLDIRIDLIRDGEEVMKTQWEGKATPLTGLSLAKAALGIALSTILTVPRIHWEAAKLFFCKKLTFFAKPVPQSNSTMQTRSPSFLERLGIRAMHGYLDRLAEGHLVVTMPDKSTLIWDTQRGEHKGDLAIRDYNFFRRILLDGDIGFGEAFMAGEWTSSDLPRLMNLLIANSDALGNHHMKHAWVGKLCNRMRHLTRPNTITGSRKNISEHYDLSNDFFKTFLDSTMMYSAGVHTRADEPLEQAQYNKLHSIIRKARIGKDDHVLEIGSGWGGFAIEAVRQTGCRVTSLTVSTEQLELARQRVREAGLEDRITIEFCDYRKITGTYDRIVSIEMLEAVGHENLGAYFAVCDRALKPGGIGVLQVITIPDQRYDAYRKAVDWIQKHIFPGGHLPSLAAITDAMTRNSKLIIEDIENIGPHYAQTLKAWRENFIAAEDRIRAMKFDDVFIRKWLYYFSYCEAAFAMRSLNDLHLVITRPHNRSLTPS